MEIYKFKNTLRKEKKRTPLNVNADSSMEVFFVVAFNAFCIGLIQNCSCCSCSSLLLVESSSLVINKTLFLAHQLL
ncbi:hypothetical protein V6Z11_A02G132400 [Gossypium hirsutum]